MSPVREEIVAAYAEHGVEGVKRDQDFLDLCARHADDTGFDATVNRISDVAAGLERVLEAQEPRDQVIFALKLFYAHRNEERRRGICRELTERRYYTRWSDEQRGYYDQACMKLERWRDYFLSFTNYNPTEGEVMFVNNQHKRLINLGLGRSHGAPEAIKENLLARLLDYELRNVPLDGFFYPKYREPGEVEERLLREAQASFAFVQLVQNSMFDKWPNYCQSEFDAAREDEARTLIFVLAGPRADLIAREDIVTGMHDWHEAISARDAVELKPAVTLAEARELVTMIREQVVAPVRSARAHLFKGVPA
jgi:hypothetical protein